MNPLKWSENVVRIVYTVTSYIVWFGIIYIIRDRMWWLVAPVLVCVPYFCVCAYIVNKYRKANNLILKTYKDMYRREAGKEWTP